MALIVFVFLFFSSGTCFWNVSCFYWDDSVFERGWQRRVCEQRAPPSLVPLFVFSFVRLFPILFNPT
ncbi:hypothetical protein BKA61DRAFT_610231 [Leptodontidium sp. MPI-SDFR-AT-0119]|nr:hypothetical protein BKA61DRAFT_610231 [Leptodontidium sp. MPI-SDFR-AT-0119]